MKPLEGRIAVVAGATRGAGRGIACALGEAGATVYCTGRSVRGKPATGKRPETIEETAGMVTARGGEGIWARVDHTVEDQVAAFFARAKKEQGRLDILVNDVWGGDELTEWGKAFWELDSKKGFLMLERAVHAHVLTSRHGVPLMLDASEERRGLIVEITDGDAEINAQYRGQLFYDLAKISAIRLALAMASELRDTHITALALSPGFLRSEAMLDHFGVTEENWREAVRKDPAFAHSETPLFVGRAVAALAADPNVREKNGKSFTSWKLAREYGFTDFDGSRPDFGAFFSRGRAKRWKALVAQVKEELSVYDLDPVGVLEHDERSLELRGALALAGGSRCWFHWTVGISELWMGAPQKIAQAFAKGYARERERRRAEAPGCYD